MELVFKEKVVMQGNVNRFVFMPKAPIKWKPGQFIHYTLPHNNADDRGDERWFTISSAPFERDVWITTRLATKNGSTFKKRLSELKPGEVIKTGVPEGSFVINDLDNEYVLVAGGIGITPFRSILNQLHHEGKSIVAELLYANRNGDNIPFKDELEAISKAHERFNITYFIGDNKIDETVLKQFATKLNDPVFYVSGPEPMVEAFKTTLEGLGIDKDHAKFDYFPGYEAE